MLVLWCFFAYLMVSCVNCIYTLIYLHDNGPHLLCVHIDTGFSCVYLRHDVGSCSPCNVWPGVQKDRIVSYPVDYMGYNPATKSQELGGLDGTFSTTVSLLSACLLCLVTVLYLLDIIYVACCGVSSLASSALCGVSIVLWQESRACN